MIPLSFPRMYGNSQIKKELLDSCLPLSRQPAIINAEKKKRRKRNLKHLNMILENNKTFVITNKILS